MGGIETESVVEWDWDQEDELKVFIYVYIFKKMNAVYLHLPAKWLGGRKPLGWGAGPYGDGAGWPEPKQESMSLLHHIISNLFDVEFLSGPVLGP